MAVPHFHRADTEATVSAHRHPAHMHPRILATRHDRPDQIARLEAVVVLLVLPMPDGKAVLVRTGHLAVAPAPGRNAQWPHASDMQRRRSTRPTQAASSQCVFGKPRLTRLYLVRPPLPVSIGRPVAASWRYRDHRVLFTAAASRRGTRTWV